MTRGFGPYSDKVMKHFMHPKNMGEIKNPDGEATVGNPICGDLMKLQIKVEKKPYSAKTSQGKNGEGYIKDIKFKTFGCAAAIATSSMITEMVKGKSLDEAMKVTKADVSDELGGLPPIKQHCSNLAADALHKAIEDYKGKLKK